jgi:hypothetical protein
MRSILPLLTLSAVLAPVQALYFYIDGTAPKCFFEELPKDTIVVGDYKAEEYDDQRKVWSGHDGLHIYISVDVCIFTWIVLLDWIQFRPIPLLRLLSHPSFLYHHPISQTQTYPFSSPKLFYFH